MASDIFAKIGDIRGDSADAKHRNEIDVLSWSWGVTQSESVTGGRGGGAAAGKASFSDLNFTHRVDQASPLLMKACATGAHIPAATITVRKAGKGQQEYLIIKMSDVLITSVAMTVVGEEPATNENVTLRPAKVDLEYRGQKPDGSLEPGIHFTYDINANKAG